MPPSSPRVIRETPSSDPEESLPIGSLRPGAPELPSAARHQRRRWDRRAAHWHGQVGANPGLQRSLAGLLEEIGPGPVGRVVDLGAGSGQLSLAVAPIAREILAVDVSPQMAEQLRRRASEQGVHHLEVLVQPIESLALPPGSVDLVVSHYALHHLRDPDKRALVAAARHWLRPGGRLVIGDLMLGRGSSAEDRAVIATKVRQLLRRGPAGAWRVLKNAARYTLRLQERPLPPETWAALLRQQGFVEVRARRLVQEAGVVQGRRP
jgi:ubiquinone/menaquinone biosynthesis C-methylase UbiE